MAQTRDSLRAALRMTIAAADAIKTAGQISEGMLYAAFMSKMDMAAFNGMIGILVNTGCVEKNGVMLRWNGRAVIRSNES